MCVSSWNSGENSVFLIVLVVKFNFEQYFFIPNILEVRSKKLFTFHFLLNSNQLFQNIEIFNTKTSNSSKMYEKIKKNSTIKGKITENVVEYSKIVL